MNPADANPNPNQNQNQMPGVPGGVSATNNPATTAAPVMPGTPVMPEIPTPVNPVVGPATAQPTVPTEQLVMPVVQPATSTEQPIMSTPQLVAPVFQPTAPVASPFATEGIMVGATDPITMPNLPKAPDPVEEELKAPMTAAAPVPGSIGSAISMPAAEAAPQTPNSVAFNDPATASVKNSMAPMAADKKKKNQKTLIMLCIAAGIVVVMLVIVLIMIMNGMISF